MDRAKIVHENFLRCVSDEIFPHGNKPNGPLTNNMAVSLYRSACLSRALDLKSRELQAQGEGFYTIGSSGHEAMAALAAAIIPTDMAFLHYRDAAFQIERSKQVPGQSILWDMLLSFTCSSEDPISGGRHKLLGSKALNIPPQTSTIASHLPKAVGTAYSLGLAKHLKCTDKPLARDSIVICSFGDASANHSTAQGAFNTAQWTAYQSIAMPILFVCEDNGIGISTKTPKNWIAEVFSNRPALKYFSCNGLDIYETYQIAQQAAEYVRKYRKPAFLHISTIRLYGHAGADMPTSYMPRAEIEAEEANDPLLHSVRLLSESGALSSAEALSIYQETISTVNRVAKQALKRPRLQSASDVMASIIPPKRTIKKSNGPDIEKRKQILGNDIQLMQEPQIMSRIINWTLADLMLSHDNIILMGEDIGKKGGVYGVTQKLSHRFGGARVIDTLLDEQSILGLGIGLAHNEFLPIPEIQFLAYLHNAEDQLRGEAATLPFFSDGQYTNPMVVRIAGLGYQKGFGGHFHNDNSFAVLRDIPGLILACPSNGEDAALMLRECVRLAQEEQRLVVFLEPIALYAARDLHDKGDGAWLSHYPSPEKRATYGETRQYGDGKDIAIVSFGNGVFLSSQAQKRLQSEGIEARIIDLRWISPLPTDSLLESIAECAQILVVDETRHSGGLAEALMAFFAENSDTKCSRLCAEDSFIATGPAYAATMPSADAIVKTVRDLVKGS